MTVLTWAGQRQYEPTGAVNMLDSAANRISNAFDTGAKVVTGIEADNQKILEQGRSQAQADYLNLVQSIKTPAEFDAAKMSGIFDTRLAALHPSMQTLARGAIDARQKSLQDQTIATQTYANSEQDYKSQGLVDRVKSLQAAGRHIESNMILDASPQIRERAPLYATGNEKTQLAWDEDIAKGKFDQSQRPIVEAGKRNTNKITADTTGRALLDLPQQLLNNGQTVANAALTLKEDSKRLNLEAQGRIVDEEVTKAVSDYQSQSKNLREAISAVAKGLDPRVVPRNQDGTMALDQMDSTQKASFNALLKSKGMRTLDDLEAGDTAAKARIIQDLQVKKYDVSHIARITAGLDFSLNTGAIAPVGGDAARIAASNEKNRIAIEDNQKKHGVAAYETDLNQLLKEGNEAIDRVLPGGKDGGIGSDAARSEIYKERLAAYLRDGAKVPVLDTNGKPMLDKNKDPVTTRVLPNPAQIQTIVQGITKKWHNTRGGWIVAGRSGMQEEIDEALNAWTNSPGAQAGAAQAARLELVRNLSAIRAKAEPPIPTVLNGNGPKK